MVRFPASHVRFDSRAAWNHLFILIHRSDLSKSGELFLSFNPIAHMNKSFGWSVTLSVVMILAGLLAIIISPLAGIAVALLIGWLLVITGGAHLLFCWHRRGVGGVLWEVLLGILYLVVGIYILMNPMAGLASLTLALAFYLFVEAILEFFLGFQLHGTKGAGWLWVDGIVDLILAIMIWKTWPVSTGWVIGTLLGFGILFTGFSRLVLSLEARRAAKETAASARS